MDNKAFDVVALGELLVDFTQNGLSEQGNLLFEANPGGAPANVLAMLRKLGKRCAFIGKVGMDVAKKLHAAGAKLIVSNNSNRAAMKYAVEELGATEVGKDEIYGVKCDIFAPCALGAVVNPKTLPMFQCRAIAGAANNVIYDDACGEALKAKGILYAPDFIINGGGVINAGQEAFTTYDKENVLKQVHNIYNTVYRMLEESKATGKPEGVIATEFAENRIYNGLDA